MRMQSTCFEDLIRGFPARRVVVVGDAMLDRFVYGQVLRISPEAPTPVILADRCEDTPGGAANVARILADLGARCRFIAAVGEDEAGRALATGLTACGVEARLVAAAGRPTTLKQRFVSDAYNAHLLRADWETCAPIAPQVAEQIAEELQDGLREAEVLVLSDYGKGLLTPALIARAIALARRRAIPVVVDPKGGRFERYAGCDLITPNVRELSEDVGRPIANAEGPVVEAARDLLARVEARAVVVTRSEHGLSIVGPSGAAAPLASSARGVVDVSGAGDAVVAGLALCAAAGADVEIAARLANAAAGVVVGKRGAASLTRGELAEALLSRPPQPPDKVITDRGDLLARVAEWKQAGLVVGFTNGCFDLIHPGHVEMLRQSRSECDRLIVAINTDASVRRLKGPDRPIQSEAARAAVLAAMSFVDLVVAFDEETPLNLIETVTPHVLIKGADYAPDEVVGADVVVRHGGRVHLAAFLPDNSTSDIVGRILKTREQTPELPVPVGAGARSAP